jgi:hypothetical protein
VDASVQASRPRLRPLRAGISLVALDGESRLLAPERSDDLDPSVEPRTLEQLRRALDKG